MTVSHKATPKVRRPWHLPMVRVHVAERTAIEQAAAVEDIAISTFIRRAAKREAARVLAATEGKGPNANG
jgi:hypothetical protein